MENNNNTTQDKNFELELQKSLSSCGFLFPTTDDEVKAFENEFDINSVELPENLQNPIKVLKKDKVTKVSQQEATVIDMNTVENLNMAARNGEKIPEEILNQMKKDRENAENDENE